MASPTIGLLHPGEMGASIGAQLSAAGTPVAWASEGRGRQTRQRAGAAGFTDAATVAGLVSRCEWLVSVCPPDAAVAVAREVMAQGFRGVFLDANAIAPSTSQAIRSIVTRGGASFVDGGIVGPPPDEPGRTRLFLSGSLAAEASALFEGTNVMTVVLGSDDGPGAASAVKMAYAAWTKGSMALLLAADALADRLGVGDALRAEWERSQPDLPARLARAESSASSKGWRWTGEMHEIATAFAGAGLPAGFHQAAAALFAAYDRPAD